MKAKKVLIFLLVSMLTIFMIACGSKDNSGKKDDSQADKTPTTSGDNTSSEADKTLEGKLVVWTLASDLQQFSEYFMEKESRS